jgi:hypothetical protein
MMPWMLILIVQGAVLCSDPSCTVVSYPGVDHVPAFNQQACETMRKGVLADAAAHHWSVSATCSATGAR